jgi:predicted DNA-binding transcriptional regulator YafY
MELVRLLRDGRVHRAEDMARELDVSLRTIYRDLDTLAASGIPIEGARGLGYRATADVTLPPLNLSATELEALHVGLAVVGDAGDKELQTAARSLSAKIDAVLPEDRSAPPAGFGFAVYPFADAAGGFAHMPRIRAAIRARQKLRVHLGDAEGSAAPIVIRPLELDYWGRVWTCTAWSETAGEFLSFRVDRVRRLDVLQGLFVDEPGKTLADFRAKTAGRARLDETPKR